MVHSADTYSPPFLIREILQYQRAVLTFDPIDNPLAQGFLLTTGHADITVPDVPTKEDYIVVCA